MKNTMLAVLCCGFVVSGVASAQPMNSDEATRKGYEYCGAHGWDCRLVDVDLYNNNIFRMNFDAAGHGTRGHLHLEFDANARKLLRADEPRVGPMNSDEATRRGLDYCRRRGYECKLVDVDLYQGNLFRLNLDAVSSFARGRMHLELDANTRNLLKVVEPAPPPQPKPMDSTEATRRAMDFCKNRGMNCQVRDADLAGNRWKLNMAVSGGLNGRIHLEFDAMTRALLDMNEDLRPGQ